MEEKKNKQARTWISSKCKKEEVCDTFMRFSVHLAIGSVYPTEIPIQPLGTLTHPLTLAELACESIGPNCSLSIRLFSDRRLPRTSVSCLLLLTVLGPCLPLSSSSLARNLTRKPYVWVSCQKNQRNPLTECIHRATEFRVPLHCHYFQINFVIE